MDSSILLNVFLISLTLPTFECQYFAGLMSLGGFNNLPSGNLGGNGGENSNCPYQVHPDKNKFFQQTNAGMIVQPCAQGTEYDHSACSCVTSKAPQSRPVPGSNPRINSLSTAMKGLPPNAPPGMQSMMAAFLRRFQNQMGGGNNAPPPAPTPPRSNPAPPSFNVPIKPQSRPPMRQMVQKPPTSVPTEQPAPPPIVPRTEKPKFKPATFKAKLQVPRTNFNQHQQQRQQQKASPVKKTAKLTVDASPVSAGPPYNPKPLPKGQNGNQPPMKMDNLLMAQLKTIQQAGNQPPRLPTIKPNQPPAFKQPTMPKSMPNLGPTGNPMDTLMALLSRSKQNNQKPFQPSLPSPQPTNNVNPFANMMGGFPQTNSNGGQRSLVGGGSNRRGPFPGPGIGAGPMGAGPMGGGPMGGGPMGALGGGSGSGMDTMAMLAALQAGGSGSSGLGGLGALGSLGAMGGSSTRGAATPPDLTNMFNTQGRMAGMNLSGLNNVNYLLLHQADRQGLIDMSDLTTGGLIAASNFLSRGGGAAAALMG